MGTSGSYGGPSSKNPLIPSWLDSEGVDGLSPEPTQEPAHEDATQQDNQKPEYDSDVYSRNHSPAIQTTANFQSARSNMSRYASSGGTKGRLLRKAISDYITKCSSGSTIATTRMGSSRNVARGLLLFVSEAQRSGVDQTLKLFNLSASASMSIEDVLVALGDELLPTSGSVDAGLARDAWEEVVVEVMESSTTSIEDLTSDQLSVIFSLFVSNSIFKKLLSDIGKATIQLPRDAKEVNIIQAQIKDYIAGAVTDAIAMTIPDISQITITKIDNLIDAVYKQSFDIMVNLGDS